MFDPNAWRFYTLIDIFEISTASNRSNLESVVLSSWLENLKFPYPCCEDSNIPESCSSESVISPTFADPEEMAIGSHLGDKPEQITEAEGYRNL